MPGLDSRRSTGLTACLVFRPRARARPWPISDTASEQLRIAPHPAAWGAVESEHDPEGNARADEVRTGASSAPPDSFHHPATSRLILSCRPMSDRNEGSPEGVTL